MTAEMTPAPDLVRAGSGDSSWTPLPARLAYQRDLTEHLARI